jgi:hypothetical protein
MPFCRNDEDGHISHIYTSEYFSQQVTLIFLPMIGIEIEFRRRMVSLRRSEMSIGSRSSNLRAPEERRVSSAAKHFPNGMIESYLELDRSIK